MTIQKIICPDCGQEISKSNFSKHQRRHQNHPETFKSVSFKLNHEGLVCAFCGKTYKNRNSLCNHERLCKSNPNRQILESNNVPRIGFNNKGRVAWNKGLTKEKDERVLKYASHLKTIIQKEGHIGTFGLRGSDNIACRNDVKEKISLTMTRKYAFPRGWAKRGWYNGVWCDSSWELAYILYANDHNIQFIRNNEYFEYMWEGCKHHYTPDFYLPETDTYIEIKGYYDAKAKAKKEQFTRNLIIYQYPDMKPILDYVVNTYGKNFTSLYTGVPK